MKKISGTVVLFFISSCILLNAQSKEGDNVFISSQKEKYEYTRGDKLYPVIISTEKNTVYYCSQFRTDVTFVEGYNDQLRIDNVAIKVDGARSSIRPSFENYSSEGIFYSDSKICYFSLPLEKKGSTSEVKITSTYLDPRYFSTVYFPDTKPVSDKVVTLIIPRWMSCEIKEINFTPMISHTKTFDAKKNADIHTYSMKGIPARKSEANAQGPSYIYPHLLILNKSANVDGQQITYFNTVADLYAWYRILTQDLGDDMAIMKTKATEITTSAKTDEAKIRAVYSWVQSNIRYIAFEDGIAGFRPDKAQEVLRKKYGDCKGMANLTKELLKSLGFDARLCWLGTSRIAYDYSTPSLAVDNHMICVIFQGGKKTFLDATETYIGYEQYAQRIQGRQVLIEDGQKYMLEQIPEMTFAQNVETEKRSLTIAENNLVGQVSQNWKGESREFLLAGINSIKKEKLSDAFVNYLTEDRKDVVTDVKMPDLTSNTGEMSVEYKVDIRNAATGFGNEWYVEMDHRKELSGSVIDTISRYSDWVFPFKYNLQHTTELALPAGAKVSSLPEKISIDRPSYRFSIGYSMNGDKVIYEKSLIFKTSVLSRKYFSQWNRDIDQISKHYLEQLVISKK